MGNETRVCGGVFAAVFHKEHFFFFMYGLYSLDHKKYGLSQTDCFCTRMNNTKSSQITGVLSVLVVVPNVLLMRMC